MAPKNRAAWLEKGEPSPPLTVGPAPYPVCGPDEVIVENKAVAMYDPSRPCHPLPPTPP